MKKLTLNDFTAMELFEIESKLEMANTLKNWGVGSNNKPKTESEIWDCLFSEAFGAFWNESEIYRLIRGYVEKTKFICDHFTKGYVTCMER